MKIHNYGKIPETVNYSYGDPTDFDMYDMETLNAYDLDEVWYWYASGDYEGSGQILYRKGRKYGLHDMGHCSCYGPLDDLDPPTETFVALRKSCSADLMKQVGVLFEMAKGDKK